jgi:hypothetical protein
VAVVEFPAEEGPLKAGAHETVAAHDEDIPREVVEDAAPPFLHAAVEELGQILMDIFAGAVLGE